MSEAASLAGHTCRHEGGGGVTTHRGRERGEGEISTLNRSHNSHAVPYHNVAIYSNFSFYTKIATKNKLLV